MLQLRNQLEQGEDSMIIGLSMMLLAIGLALVLNAYLLQDIRNLIKKEYKEENKPKQFKREHSSISKTNFR